MSKIIKILSALIILCASFTVQAAESDPFVAAPGVAVVDTNAGKVQGYIHEDIFTYHGIPYAEAERFMPPTKVKKWPGIRMAMSYGNISSQVIEGNDENTGGEIFLPKRYRNWPQNDDCQNLNIWTPAINDNKKRPVMVWLHGGGFAYGSSSDLTSYDGENLSKKGDVVVVSVNHRLNALGFLDLSAYGGKYKYSGNLGMMDIVASLEWVKENISKFGGDPNNITLFGESGGGAKILTLMGTPAAEGLFHKAIVQSGAVESMGMTLTSVKSSRRVAELTLENLGIKPDEVDKIKDIPYEKLIEAGNRALNQTAQEQKTIGPFGKIALNWAPIMDGDYIPVEPVGNSFATLSKDIPLLIGSNLTEFNTFGYMNADVSKLQSDNKNTWSDDEIKNRLKQQYGNKADGVTKAFSKAYPNTKIADALFVDSMHRKFVLKTATLKADQKGAPVYNYMFTWETPVMGGFMMSYHTAEIPFVFNNIGLAESATGGTKKAYALADKMSSAWINFAKNGDPNGKKLPKWEAFTRENGATMIFDNKSEVKYNHDQELIEILVPGYKY